MTSQTDYCPIAVGVDVLGDRWTPLVIRELMVGASGFNEIHRGIPRVSRTLLAQRLRLLERQGLVTREVGERGRPGRYVLTPAGQALTPIVWAIGRWAAEWVFGDPTDEDCDGLSLIWRMHQHAIPARLPQTRTVVHLVFTGTGAAEGWLDINHRGISVCKDDQGLDTHLAVEANTAQMHTAGWSGLYRSTTWSPRVMRGCWAPAGWRGPSRHGSTQRTSPRGCAARSNVVRATPSRPTVRRRPSGPRPGERGRCAAAATRQRMCDARQAWRAYQMMLNRIAASSNAIPWKTTAVRCPWPWRKAWARTAAANGRNAMSISSTVFRNSTTRSALRMWSNMT
jgi:DNA-binding HxlR family transcriptional regulator